MTSFLVARLPYTARMTLYTLLPNVVLRHWFPRLLPAVFGVLLVISQLDAITNWSMLREQLRAASPGEIAVLAIVLPGVWALLAGLALRGVTELAPLRWLRRQPVTDGRIGLAALLCSVPIWPVPVGFAWLIAAAPGWLAIAVPIALICGLMSWFIALGQPRAAALSLLGLGMIGAASAWHPGTAAVAAVLVLLAAPRLGRGIRSSCSERAAVSNDGARVPASSPARALSRLHRLCLSREHRSERWSAMAIALPATALLGACRWNGGMEADALWSAFVILLLLVCLSAYGILDTIAMTLTTPRLLGHRAPLAATTQLTALVLTTAWLVAPAGLLLVIIAAGATGVLTWVLPVSLGAAIALMVLSQLLRLRYLPRSNGVGVFGLLALAAALLLIRWPLPGSLALLGLSLLWAYRLLDNRRWIVAGS